MELDEVQNGKHTSHGPQVHSTRMDLTSRFSPDFLQHWIIECGRNPIVRNWTRHKMGIILRMDRNYIPQKWILRPAFPWMAAAKECCNFMDIGPSRPLSPADLPASLIARLYGFFWTLPVGRCTSKHAHAPNKAIIWTCSIPHIYDATYWNWPPSTRLRGQILYQPSSSERIDALKNN